MQSSAINLKIPGKLMIAGEYAVVEPPHQAIVAAVDRYVHIHVEPSAEHRLSLPDWGMGDISWQYTKGWAHMSTADARLCFIESALTTVYQYLGQPEGLDRPFHFTIESELDDASGKKYGLGSSAAVVVAVTAALLELADEKVPFEIIYKLAVIAHFRVQASGSGADVAAAVFGGWLCYTAFSHDWLSQCLREKASVAAIVEQPWPYFQVTRLHVPDTLALCVGWTGQPAKTGPLVEKVMHFGETSPERYHAFLQASDEAIGTFCKGLETGSTARLFQGLSHNRQTLTALGSQVGIPIETSQLADLAEAAELLGAAAKPSGAGAGDCGIALIDTASVERLYEDWRKKDIQPLPLRISPAGVRP